MDIWSSQLEFRSELNTIFEFFLLCVNKSNDMETEKKANTVIDSIASWY